MEFGLLGERLGHSYSPRIHQELGGYDYRLIELRPDQLPAFLKKKDFRGLNVTIPYKQAVIPFLDGLTERAERIGAVNTILRRADGTLLGDNTDYAGFMTLLDRAGLRPEGRKCLVLGSGGASHTAVACLRDRGAREIRVISRRGEDHYGNLDRHRDAELIVNTTPVGMYPGNGVSPVNLADFPALRGVADLIYNPLRTALLLQAEESGIPAAGGLGMLVAQARAAAEVFLGKQIPPAAEERILGTLEKEARNWVLIGMPGCGKTTVGRLLSARTGRKLVDTDELIEREAGGRRCGDLIRGLGEEAFRALEARACAEAGKASGTIIATGGGAVTRPENRQSLRQNGILIHLDRPPEALAMAGDRPLSRTREDLDRLYRDRAPLYAAWRDLRVESGSPEEAAEKIQEALE